MIFFAKSFRSCKKNGWFFEGVKPIRFHVINWRISKVLGPAKNIGLGWVFVEKKEVKAIGFWRSKSGDTKQMAQKAKGRLVKGQYKPICRDCAMYFSSHVHWLFHMDPYNIYNCLL